MKKKVRKPRDFVLAFAKEDYGALFYLENAHLPTMKKTLKRLEKAIAYLEQEKKK